MLDSFVCLLTEYGVGTAYVKIAVLLYSVCYVIEEVLGKYRCRRSADKNNTVNWRP